MGAGLPPPRSQVPCGSESDDHHPDTVQRACLTAVGTRRTGLAATSVAWSTLQHEMPAILPWKAKEGGGGV